MSAQTYLEFSWSNILEVIDTSKVVCDLARFTGLEHGKVRWVIALGGKSRGARHMLGHLTSQG